VIVRVREHHSQFVWVRGAVGRPGRKPLRGGTRLVDALLEAGGLAAGASGEVVVERPGGFADGRREERLLLRSTPGERELQQLGMALEPGDIVTAVLQGWVVVSGAVRRPGRYPLGEIATVLALVEAAGGRLGGAGVVVRRRDALGTMREIAVDLDAVRRGAVADTQLLPGDQVLIGSRR
jgi:protein involved in polysaccharide export with SLBB domain